jgi:glutathione S-transferase
MASPQLDATTLKLYYSPGACSLSPHIALRELDLDVELVKVDTKTKRMDDNRDFREINPYGYVPALELDDGEIVTEGPAIVQYLADLRPEVGIAPPNGTIERTRVQSALALINSEIHKAIGGLFNPALDEAGLDAAKAKIDARLDVLERQLGDDHYLANNRYSVADAYLFVVMRWLRFFKISLDKWPHLAAHHQRIGERPAVQAAMAEEGLK